MSVRRLALCGLFAALIALCAWLSIPMPWGVAYTLQTFGVFAALLVLGGMDGTIAIAVYVLLGAVGLPVFSSFQGGLGALLGPTGGYIWGFLASGLLFWLLERLCGTGWPVRIFSAVVGLLVCYALGTLWFCRTYAGDAGTVSFGTALGWCVVPYVIPDTVKLALALILGARLRPLLQKTQKTGDRH